MSKTKDEPFFGSRKVKIMIIGIVAILVLVISSHFIGIDDENLHKALNLIEWLVGLAMGTHTVSDVSAMWSTRGTKS